MKFGYKNVFQEFLYNWSPWKLRERIDYMNNLVIQKEDEINRNLTLIRLAKDYLNKI